jgi:exosortase
MPTTVERRSEEAASRAMPPSSLPARYIQGAVVGILLVVAFWPILPGMYGSWFDEHAYMEHGILVVPAAMFMVWTKRNRLQKIPCEPSRWGLILLFWGAVQATLAVAAHWIWASRIALLISLAGLIVALYGLRMAWELIYPLCALILMIAPPTFVYERLTLSLQLLASRLGEFCLEAIGYSVVREGNILEMVGAKLSIEEACSGLRSLLSILFMCTLYNFFFVLGKWMRTLILALAVPIAILGNACRIVATGIASQYNRELIHGAAHEAFGYVSIIVAGIGCVALHIAMLRIQKVWLSRHA